MIKLTFTLHPEDGRITPYDHPYGHTFRGVVMKWLHEINPELVHELHLREQVRPYSVNYVISKKEPRLDFVIVAYHDKLSDVLVQDLISGGKGSLKFGEKEYLISSIRVDRINPKNFVTRSQPVKSFTLNFLRPVYFNTNMGDFPVRFPIPVVLFGNLGRIWNEIVGNNGSVDVKAFQDWTNAHVYVSNYDMRTVKANIGKSKPVSGGLGRVSYRISKINKPYYRHLLEQMGRERDHERVNDDYRDKCRWLEALCLLGEFTNVGANRTAAMGAMRYKPNGYLSKSDLLTSS